MNPLDLLQPYLYGPEDTISHEYDSAAYRLTAEDKLSLEKAILVRGAKAIENVTKGGAVLYQRSPQRFSGEDEAYLRSLFAPGTEIIVPWGGPDHIVVSQREPDTNGVIVVESYSPFEDRFLRLPYTKKLDGADGIAAYQFCATMQARNSLRVLQQHGRLESLPHSKLPKIARHEWQGIWVPTTRHRRVFAQGGQMASEIGPIAQDGGDYLRFLLIVKAIGKMKTSIAEKRRVLSEVERMRGQSGTHFSVFINKARMSLEGIMKA
ncbi:hypothetical protein [Pseudomonas putida]|uniref:Uncharacterized protein n=1 Tax=Pseudomonas putida TaxID=303 RepID=A0A9X8HM98_PSEPU|nr:hypothetical protein [Pseudomonas putida]ROQ53673.1 hypothetical protein EDF85_1437 [Pseudomonas putida]